MKLGNNMILRKVYVTRKTTRLKKMMSLGNLSDKRKLDDIGKRNSGSSMVYRGNFHSYCGREAQ